MHLGWVVSSIRGPALECYILAGLSLSGLLFWTVRSRLIFRRIGRGLIAVIIRLGFIPDILVVTFLGLIF